MVRVISEKLFSPPRSRHSSGEALDKELAARAVEALSSLDSRKFDFSDYESSSDSHWDSEIDAEGDSQDGGRCFEENGGTEVKHLTYFTSPRSAVIARFFGMEHALSVCSSRLSVKPGLLDS